MSNKYIIAKALEVVQPIGSFYVCTLSHSDIINISFTDVRRLEGNKREVEEYIGIQRELSPKRVKEIEKYVNLVDASFPNTLILSISSKFASYDSNNHEIQILNNKDVGKVLDGQHRIAGLEGYSQAGKPFDVIVAVFIDMELEDQAILFATINKTQTKVNKSLADDLYEFAKSRSPQKTCHNIVRVLDQMEKSPFHGKIKILGTAIDKEKETITQATFVESLIKYISADKMKDRDDLKRGRKLELLDNKKYFLRKLFIEEKDTEIARLVMEYFKAVQQRWPRAWNNVEPETILNRSTGFIALMKFFPICCERLGYPGKILAKDDFYSIFKEIEISEEMLVKTRYIPGSSGQSKLFNDLNKGL
nr:DGQHR domain-containing protein [uncultured Sphaerochaeta sp.]